MGNFEPTSDPRGDQQHGCKDHENKVERSSHPNIRKGVEAKDEGSLLPQHCRVKKRTMDVKSQGNKFVFQHQRQDEKKVGHMQNQ
jgi:hypothetical protein